ncbi:MAG: hypothetical protein ACFFCS_24675 [Candidatus Hodarchaeota archaeon]
MTRDAPLGALISILIGFGLLILKPFIMPGINLNAWMITAIQSLDLGIDDWELYSSAIGGLINMPHTNDALTPLSMIQYIYAAFLSFPSVIGWFIGGMIVSHRRIRRGIDQGNLRGGWATFWYGLMSIELPLVVFGVIFLITAIIPGAGMMSIQGFTGSVVLFFLLFLLQPMFWFAMLFALLGSAIGGAAARKQ